MFILGEIFACVAIFGSIGKSNSPSIVYMMICPLSIFALIIFFVDCTLLRWAYISIDFIVHPESATVELPFFVSCFFLVGAQARFLHTSVF